MPQRILYVEGNPDGTIGGSYFSLLFLVKNLDQARFSPIVVFATPNALVPQFEAAGAEVIVRGPAPPVTWRHPLLRPVKRLTNLLRAVVLEPIRLARFIRRQRVALVHLNNSIERNHPWMIAAILAGVPRITHERGINEQLSRQARYLVPRLDGVICISRAVRQNLERLGLEQRQLTTIWNGLDAAEMTVRKDRAAVLEELGLEPGARLIGMVGNIRTWKGQAVVVEAMAAVARAHPDVVCLLVGHAADIDRDYRRSIEQTLAEGGLERRVIITGYRSNVPDYIAALEILIHASVLPEPFGRVLLEGMALRKPVVASRGGAVPEIVEDGVTGLLFEPGAANELADRLLRLLGSPAAARAMGEAGFERLRSQFGIDSNARATMALYDRIAD